MAGKDTTMGGKNSAFPTTYWTNILHLQNTNSSEYAENLNKLFSLYWKPVYKYICCGWRVNREDAKDLTQEFFLSLLTRESLKEITPTRGKFRSFLKAALKNFMLNYKRDKQRIKRGGKATMLSLDYDLVKLEIPQNKTLSPDEIFVDEWAKTVMNNALKRIEQQYAIQHKPKYLEVFRMYYLAKTKSPPSYGEIADKLGISKFDVGNYLKAVRNRCRQVIMEIIREYASDEQAAEEEFRELMERLL